MAMEGRRAKGTAGTFLPKPRTLKASVLSQGGLNSFDGGGGGGGGGGGVV
jgi:hypothetical protein